MWSKARTLRNPPVDSLPTQQTVNTVEYGIDRGAQTTQRTSRTDCVELAPDSGNEIVLDEHWSIHMPREGVSSTPR